MTLDEIVASLAAWCAIWAHRVELALGRLDLLEDRVRRLERRRLAPKTDDHDPTSR